MNIATHLQISSKYTKYAELYRYEDYEDWNPYEELIVPAPYKAFVSDIYFNKLKLPDTLIVLDLWFDDMIDFEFNIPPKIEEIILIKANILNKNLMDLFPKNLRYNYSECSLNNIPIYTCVYNLYTKYFPEEYMSLPKNVLNSINYRNESRYINEIQEYEARIAQGRAFRLAIKEELIATVWHPDKVEKIINKYGIDYLDNL